MTHLGYDNRPIGGRRNGSNERSCICEPQRFTKHTTPINKMTFTQAPKLKGEQLLQKVQELANVDKRELVIACGYFYMDEEGLARGEYTEFYESLLEAKGVSLCVAETKEDECEDICTENSDQNQELTALAQIWDKFERAKALGDDDLHYEAIQQFRSVSKPIDTFQMDSREYAVKSARLLLPQFYKQVIGNDEKAQEAAEFMAINFDLYNGLYDRVTTTTFGNVSVWIAHQTLSRFHAHWAARRGVDEESLINGANVVMFDHIEKDIFKASQSTDEWLKEDDTMNLDFYGENLIGNFASVLITDCYKKFDNHQYCVPSFYYDQIKRLGEQIHSHRTKHNGAHAFIIDSIMHTICSSVMYNELLFENTNQLSEEERATFVVNRFDEIEQYYLDSI